MYFAIKTTVRVGAGRDWVVEEGGGLAVPGFINSYHCRGHGPVPGRPGSTEGTLGGAPAGAAGGFPPPTRPAGGARGPGTAAPALFKCFSAVRSPWRPGCGGLWRGNRRRRGWRGTWRGRGVRPAGDQRGVSRCMLHFPGPAARRTPHASSKVGARVHQFPPTPRPRTRPGPARLARGDP